MLETPSPYNGARCDDTHWSSQNWGGQARGWRGADQVLTPNINLPSHVHVFCWPYLFHVQVCSNTQMLTIGFWLLMALSIVMCCTMLSLRATGLPMCLAVTIYICVSTCWDLCIMMELPNCISQNIFWSLSPENKILFIWSLKGQCLLLLDTPS